MRIQPIILAAGKGTRMGNPDLPKVLQPLKGKPLISYLLKTLDQTPFLKPALVVGFRHELVREAVGPDYRYIHQEEQRGTADAILCCAKELQGTADAFLIMCGDQPLWKAVTIENLVAKHEEEKAVLSLATVVSNYPSFEAFGRILRSPEGALIGMREFKNCTPEEKAINEYNPSLFCCSDSWLWDALRRVQPSAPSNEYYFTDIVSFAVEEHRKVATSSVVDWQETLGVNTPDQLAEVSSYL